MSSSITIRKFYSAPWCVDCRRCHQFLDVNNIKYETIDIDSVPGAADEVAKINNGYKSIPTIVFSDGTILVEPNNNQLAAKLGIAN